MSEPPAITTADDEAAILASIGSHSRHRPRSIIEVAEYLEKKLAVPGADVEWVAKTVGFKDPVLVDRFLACLKLPRTVREIVGWEGSKEGKVGLQGAYEISKLDSTDDMDGLAKVAAEFKLTTKEIVNIVQLKKRNPRSPISECVERVKKLRPVITKGFAVVTSIRGETFNSLVLNARLKGVPTNELLRAILDDYLPDNSLVSADFRDGFLFLFLNETGYQQFLRLSSELNVPKEDLVEELISRDRENGKRQQVGSTLA